MEEVEPSAEILAAIEQVTAKRPRTVLDHILKHGYITTDDLKEKYGYNHPPRAARDVRECGIPLETTRVRGPDGRMIAAYRFPTGSEADAARVGGRRAFPKAFKELLVRTYGESCNLCGVRLPSRALQVDHRIPYEVAGEATPLDPQDFQLVCGSCNRSKSWTCEHCPNWTLKREKTCATCAWASPENYSHVATEEQRRLTLVWQGRETKSFDALKEEAASVGEDLASYLKKHLHRPK